MMCPNCHELIESSLLAEIDEISCQHCKEGVPVRNVLISARGMTINRDDLIKRFFRYKKLLHEVVEERAQMEQDGSTTENSKKSADQFISTLEELMKGARDHFRLQFSLTVPVRFSYEDKLQSGWLINLSMVGACIETENIYFMPSIGDIIRLDFSLPGEKLKFSLKAMIAWIKPAGSGTDTLHDIGVKFIDVDDQAKSNLWHLISSSVHEAMSEGRQTAH